MNTIVILSQDFLEPSTDEVIDWIVNLGYKFKRINGIYLDDLNFEYNNNLHERLLLYGIDSTKVKAIWYRRFDAGARITLKLKEEMSKIKKLDEYKKDKFYEIIRNIENEYSSLTSFFISDLLSLRVKFLSKPNQISVNKLIVCKIASCLNINTPEFAIITKRIEIVKYLKKWGRIITKDINISGYYEGKKEYFVLKTQEITNQSLKSIPNVFLPSIIQKYIEKEFEIRSFYLNGEIYSMAIFSQFDKKTEIDFRNYNVEKPNRTVPFKLPADIELKLTQLMKVLNLDTGSIDIIFNKNEYYFLEVNPIGQFGMVSFPCNYIIEKKIAEFLTK